jgi:hypothetical protein
MKDEMDNLAVKRETQKSVLKNIEMPNHAVHSTKLLFGTPASTPRCIARMFT